MDISVEKLLKEADQFVNFLYYENGYFYYEIVSGFHTYMYRVPDNYGRIKLFATHKTREHERFIRASFREKTLQKLI